VYSIFEPDVELIMRGRRGKPIEFGHKVLLTQSREIFITDYLVFVQNRRNSNLLSSVLERYADKFGLMPETIAGDNA
jgi:transposase, IS5 family